MRAPRRIDERDTVKDPRTHPDDLSRRAFLGAGVIASRMDKVLAS
jgi:hypothetical protein